MKTIPLAFHALLGSPVLTPSQDAAVVTARKWAPPDMALGRGANTDS